MTRRTDTMLPAIILAAALALGSCSESASLTGPAGPVAGAATGTALRAPALASCPTTETHSAQRTVGILGGSVSAGGTTIDIPAGAVAWPTTFEVTVPASTHMEVAISAQGHEHFQFLLPVTIVIDYSRCNSTVADSLLAVFHIDEVLKTLLELMPGIDDKTHHRFTFITDHLSGYAIAN